MQADGYSLDDKREKIETNDLPDIVKEWKTRNKNKNDDRKAKHFCVPLKELSGNGYDLSINRYKDVDNQPVLYEKPGLYWSALKLLEQDIQKGIKELKGMSL